MSTQAPGGLKHAATEPAHLDNKRERRRGAAAGRAAALRRAPSDSDCSGETASLSADSAERVARPPPPAARSGKTRSRRRGSEWEVLEGLKDGQRFDRRPEVFNGYLHKKRKWPLKGWHKRFFVIDGGILVYARSPTDVARGRLHGSVDVGLSVISAKPRRRRIDIDADEFIYHLRAKTPDVFRTWLSVLKAHRLYRQHLLTFGARESVPKILAPLEDLPATDTSSHSTESNTTFTISSSSSEDLDEYPKPGPVIHSSPYFQDVTCYHTSVESGCHHTHVPIGDKEVTVERRSRNTESDKNKPNTRNDYRSLCSMKCMKMLVKDAHAYSNKSPEMSTDMENQVLSTNLDVTSLRSDDARLHSTLLCDNSNPPIPNSPKKEGKRLILFERPPTTLFLFGHKKRNHLNPDALAPMKKSRKCTNLVKYRNLIEEPTLKKPLSHNMLLLSKYKLNISKQYQASTDVQVQARNKASKYVQKTMTTSDCDLITDRLIRTVFARNRETYTEHDMTSVKRYIVQVIHELYDMKYHKDDKHPLKTLFRALLDYWIKNSTIEIAKEMHGKSINRPSNSYFTVDRNISSGAVCTSTKSTQIDHRDKTRHGTRIPEPKLKFNERPISDSQEKELRIQELERLLKNTVYICDTVLDSQSKEKDIKITKKLIDNLEKVSKELSNSGESNDNSNSSAEIPKIQETINHLISDASIPRVVAKEFLFAYLDVLLRDEDEDSISTSSSGKSKDSQEPLCDVQADCVQRVKRVSKSILVTNNSNDSENAHDKLPDGDDQLKGGTGQLYLKDIIDKITSIFKKSDEHVSGGDHEETEPGKVDDIKDEKKLPLKNYVGENIFDNHTEKSIVVGMSDYDLHNLPRINNPSSKGMMAVALQLRDKVNSKESRRANFSLKFSDVSLPISEVKSNTSQRRMQGLFRSHFDPRISFKNPYDCWPREKMVELRPFLSASDATSKAYFRGLRNSVNSFDFSIKDSVHPIPNYFDPPKGKAFEPQPCYVISAFQTEKLPNELHSGKKELVRDSISPHKGVSTSKEEDLIDKTPPESTVFDKTPKLIDEKFIVLLLENIALLSQALPNVHKEIESLYFKLRKKHEDSLNISSHKGLSLLGKIYNEQTTLNAHNVKTQFDKKMVGNRGSYDDFTPIIDTGVNTSYTELTERKKEKQFEDRCVSAYRLLKEINDYACQVSNMKIDCGTDMSNETRNVVGDNTLEKRENQAVSQKDAKYATGEPDKYVRKDYIEKKNAKIHPIPPFITSSNVSSVKGMKTMRTVLEETLYREENSDTIHGSQNLNPLASILSAPSIEEVEVINSKYWCEVQDNVRRFGKIIKDYLKNSGTNLEYAMPDLVEDGDYTEPNSVEVVVKEQPKPPKPDRVDKQSSAIKRELYKELGAFIPTCKVSTESQTDKRFVMHVKNKKAIETDYAVYQLFVSNRYGCTKSSSTMSILTTDISDDVFNLFRSSSDTHIHGVVSPAGPAAGFVSGTPGGRLASWIIESGGPLESASRSLGQAAVSVAALRRLLDALDLHQHHHDTDVSLEGAAASPNVKKDRRKFGLRKKKSNSKCASVELAPPLLDGSASHMTLSALTAPPSPGGGASSAPSSAASLPIACAAARPQSLPGAESLAAAAGPASLTSLTPDQQLREDFTVLAKDLVATLKGVVSTLVCERGRLRAAMDASEAGAAAAPPAVLAALRTNLNSALQQNSELRSRLSRIHDASDLAEISSVNISDPATRQFQQSLSYSSSCVSASEFFDAEEHDDDAPAEDGLPGDEAGVIELDGDSSSEAGSLSSEDGSATSDNSEVLSAEPITLRLAENGSSIEPHSSGWARRTRLPCPRPTPGGPSLWNLLYKNIGKDLSQISMPVTINEPLNMLQRLCEELEYSELLDSASQCQEPLERAALVAAFAVSAYAAAAHRAASKPFNPLLAETYECSRDDKGFQFIAEQVSHHPPVSVCYAQSSRWVVWQEARIKTRFWGKSMEFQPAGKVHLRLLPSGDHYSWNKVTTCVHNLFGGQRWVDQYGDMLLACHDSDVSAKLNFIKASSWSSSRHEVRGAVVDGSGRRLRLQGRWSEALYAGDPPAARCLWRPGAMPAEHESYYGFTRFAMELNEMEPGMREALPHTDTRFRPDQRALEEGRIEAAERYKHELEQAQRERRRDSPEHTPVWFRKSVEEGQECWSFAGEYWKARAAGFPALPAPRLW